MSNEAHVVFVDRVKGSEKDSNVCRHCSPGISGVESEGCRQMLAEMRTVPWHRSVEGSKKTTEALEQGPHACWTRQRTSVWRRDAVMIKSRGATDRGVEYRSFMTHASDPRL